MGAKGNLISFSDAARFLGFCTMQDINHGLVSEFRSSLRSSSAWFIEVGSDISSSQESPVKGQHSLSINSRVGASALVRILLAVFPLVVISQTVAYARFRLSIQSSSV